ncbi:MAG: ABC transporter permease [Bacteroidota bacterium]|nr:ABC transporter permease [Bacteroidota bacterium]
MLHLLKIEWLKVKNYRTFWILSALFIISIFGINYIVLQVQQEVKKTEFGQLLGGPFDFPQVWHSVAYVSSFLLFIPGLLMIISITNEFSYKTHRQNIIDGLSRQQFISVKMMLAVIIAFVSTTVVFIMAFLFGKLSGGTAINFDRISYIGMFFIQTLSYSMLALLFGLLFRRSGIAIGVFFLYMLIIDELIAGVLKRYIGQIGYYMPLESNDVLIPLPFGKQIISRYFTRPDTMYLLIAVALYLLAYFIFNRRKFATTDL